jgi:feruloyl esterase
MACTSAVAIPKLIAMECKGPKRVTCLAVAQVTALEKIFVGARNANGEPFYSDWVWDRGIGGRAGDNFNQGWRVWKMGPFDAAVNNAINVNLGAMAIAALSTPPVPLATTGPGPVASLLSVNFNRDAARLSAESPEFPRSVAAMMTADSTNLTAFRSRGGKLVIVHGVSDPVFSIKDSIRWWTALDQANNGGAAAFVRLFGVPGMNHCAGGPGTDQFDAFGALVAWVEKNTAPERIEATAGPATPWPGRTRPLCSYPKQARYRGTGSIEEAASFACE